MSYVGRIRQLSEENILSALYHLTCHFHRSAHSRLPERHIENMMKSKRYQRSLNNTKDQCTHISASGYKTSQRINSVLHRRPYKVQQNTDKHIDYCGYDRHKSGTSEKGKGIGKHNFMKTIVQGRYSKTHDNSSEHTHLQCGDSDYICYRPFQNVRSYIARSVNLSVYKQHTADGNIHNEKGDQCGKGRNFFFPFSHTNGYSHSKDQG